MSVFGFRCGLAGVLALAMIGCSESGGGPTGPVRQATASASLSTSAEEFYWNGDQITLVDDSGNQHLIVASYDSQGMLQGTSLYYNGAFVGTTANIWASQGVSDRFVHPNNDTHAWVQTDRYAELRAAGDDYRITSYCGDEFRVCGVSSFEGSGPESATATAGTLPGRRCEAEWSNLTRSSATFLAYMMKIVIDLRSARTTVPKSEAIPVFTGWAWFMYDLTMYDRCMKGEGGTA
jgi:hypothetical protein